MRDVRVLVELEKIIPVSMKEGGNPEVKASEILHDIIKKDKQKDSYLSTFEIVRTEIELIEDDLMFAIVKKAIDAYDPYVLLPDSHDEYDGESSRIAEEIDMGMSVDDIAEIMKEEFNRSFTPTFTKEDFSHSAQTVINFLDDSSRKTDAHKKEVGEKVYVYVKLVLGKIIPVQALNEEEGIRTAVKMVHNQIDSDEKSEASFTRSFGWGHYL